MSRIVFLNGIFVPEADAKISVFDRAVLFGDAIYEVTSVIGGRMVLFEEHMARLVRSAAEVNLCGVPEAEALLQLHQTLIEQNALEDGMVYLQMSRGNSGDRDYGFQPEMAPTIFAFTQSKPDFAAKGEKHPGLRICTLPDLRWARRDIKSTQLLYPVLAKQKAVDAGFDDAWLVQDGFITEGTTNNAGIIIGDRIITRQLGSEILPGTARAAMIEAAKAVGLCIEERPFSVSEIAQADEAFITSSMNMVMPVVEIDDLILADGSPGPIVENLRRICLKRVQTKHL